MSGLVAGRLFNLLPPRMPLEQKYALVETLWKEYCPRSDKVLLIGADANQKDIVDTIQSHLLDIVVHYDIPEPLHNRFNWLSGGDVNIKQQLLNYFLQKERELITHAMNHRIPVLLKHLNKHGPNIHKMKQQIEIGKHKLDLEFDSKTNGIQLIERSSYYRSRIKDSTSNWGCLLPIVIVILIILARYLFSK